ncbi:MAG: VacJ family lipoprotein [Candidatus Binatia bacterium]
MSVNRRKLLGRRLGAAFVACLVTVSAPAAALADGASNPRDPWASLNRPFFRFNDALDRYALEPVAKGYDFILPEIVEGWVTNFFANLWFPVVFTNCVLQAKPREATQSLARFMVNTTIGLGGFGDPATRLKVPAPNEDFGQTLGYWGVGTGPYLVLPFMGPSNVRDTAGRLVDSANRVWPYFVPWYVTTGTGVVEVINTRARYLEQVEDLRESSVDYYAAVRDAYLQRREALVEDRVGSGDRRDQTSDDDLYYPEVTEPAPQ